MYLRAFSLSKLCKVEAWLSITVHQFKHVPSQWLQDESEVSWVSGKSDRLERSEWSKLAFSDKKQCQILWGRSVVSFSNRRHLWSKLELIGYKITTTSRLKLHLNSPKPRYLESYAKCIPGKPPGTTFPPCRGNQRPRPQMLAPLHTMGINGIL